MRKSVDQKRLKEFGRHLSDVRKSLGFTQEDLAHKAGLTLSQIARIETGAINTSINTIFIISDALGIEPSQLFESK